MPERYNISEKGPRSTMLDVNDNFDYHATWNSGITPDRHIDVDGSQETRELLEVSMKSSFNWLIHSPLIVHRFTLDWL